jgi:hypothetical protein
MAETIDIPHEEVKDAGPEIIVLKFADSAIPVFKEQRNKDYIKYGKDNAYPEYLTYLFDKSGKHGAIIGGKAKYIFGEGFENGDFVINRLGESLNDISKKAILDIEIYGGFKLEIIWNRGGKIGEIYHVDYSTIRVGKECGYYYKEAWNIRGENGTLMDNNREEAEFIPGFNPAEPYGSQIYAYNEYRPMTRYYPLPSYIACNNYVETDIEISKFYLSSIRNGMMPSKMLQFYMGDPGEEKKAALERSFKKKFAGSENAGKFILVFNPGGKDKTIDVEDLSGTELDKMFIELNKTCQQEIFSGHSVTSPMLFGIKTEGQLGGNTELKTAYELFVNTYGKPKANSFEKEITYLLGFSTWLGMYELVPTDPVGWVIPDELLVQAVTPDEVRAKLGLPVIEKAADSPATKTLNAISGVSPLVATKILDNLTKNEIRGLAGLAPVAGGDVIPESDKGQPPIEPGAVAAPGEASAAPINENLKNLSAKQLQHVNRVIKQYQKGTMTELMARTLLSNGYGLTDDDITKILGVKPAPVPLPAPSPVPIQAAAFSEEVEDGIVAMFDGCGEAKDDYEILKSKKVCFSDDIQAEDDEAVFIKEAFKTYDVTVTESKILDLIKKDSKITPDVIGKAIGQSKAFVEGRIDSLMKRGYLESTIETIGADQITERTVSDTADIIAPPPTPKAPAVQIFIKYSYEVKSNIGPTIIPTTRAFCRKMVALNRLYSRADIEKISLRLGYSVFDRKGGWWGKNPECRHRWVSHIVVKKGGEK